MRVFVILLLLHQMAAGQQTRVNSIGTFERRRTLCQQIDSSQRTTPFTERLAMPH